VIRRKFVRALGFLVLSPSFVFASPRLADPLASLRDPDPNLRRAAIDQVVQENLRKGIKPLRRALNDSNVLVRESAAWALGQMRDVAGAQALSNQWGGEKSLLVRVAIVEALERIRGSIARETVKKALQDPSPIVRKAAAAGLAEINSGEEAERLRARRSSGHKKSRKRRRRSTQNNSQDR
jgi:HEAT repeat protein